MARSDNRFSLRLSDELKGQMSYWASKENVSDAEFVRLCISEKLERSNGDFDVPSLGLARLNQLVDVVEGLRVEQANFQAMLSSVLSSFTALVHGDDYFSLTSSDEEVLVNE